MSNISIKSTLNLSKEENMNNKSLNSIKIDEIKINTSSTHKLNFHIEDN